MVKRVEEYKLKKLIGEKIHRRRSSCLCKKFFGGKRKMYERLCEAPYS